MKVMSLTTELGEQYVGMLIDVLIYACVCKLCWYLIMVFYGIVINVCLLNEIEFFCKFILCYDHESTTGTSLRLFYHTINRMVLWRPSGDGNKS